MDKSFMVAFEILTIDITNQQMPEPLKVSLLISLRKT